MRLYKEDKQNWTVREVEGELYPGHDADGKVCYPNSHFHTEAEAWASLKISAELRVSMAGEALAAKKVELQAAQAKCGEAAIAFATMTENMRLSWRD